MMEIDPLYADIPCVHCPTCGEKFLRTADLEVHRERHRPILPRRKGSVSCPKGCRRWLEPETAETQIHLALCDGSPPLDGLSTAMNRKWFCPEHDFGTDGPRAWGIHKRDHHNGQDPVALVKSIEPEGKDAISAVVAVLRKERSRVKIKMAGLTGELARVEAALQALGRRKAKA